MAIQVVLADDAQIVRVGLSQILSEYADMQVVGEAEDGYEAVRLCQQFRPDVALMDVRMPRMDGVEATRLIRHASPKTQVIALSDYADPVDVRQMLQAGALSFLMKNISAQELAATVRSTCEGKSTLSPEPARLLIELNRGTLSTDNQPKVELTTREADVLSALAKGLTNRQIAQELNMSFATVKGHVSSLMSKMGTTSRAHTAVKAVEFRLLS